MGKAQKCVKWLWTQIKYTSHVSLSQPVFIEVGMQQRNTKPAH